MQWRNQTTIATELVQTLTIMLLQQTDPELVRWLIDKGQQNLLLNLLTVDFIMQGVPWVSLAGGDAAWAFGYERSDYNIETTLPILPGPTAANAMTNIHDGNFYPCEIPEWNEFATGPMQEQSCLCF